MENLIDKFSKVKILVVGDVMLDRYWWGNVSRISPEAPVPVVNLQRISETAGGAANVAANIAGLGAEPFLVGFVGDDEGAEIISNVLITQNVAAKHLIRSASRKTTVKTRIIAHNQQIVRIDQETKADLTGAEESEVLGLVSELIDKVEVIVFSDYGKGIGTENLIKRLITLCAENGKSILIDPKGKNFNKYQGATMLTPNRLELIEACNLENTDQLNIEEYGSRMQSELKLKYLLVTQGEDGMTLFEKDKKTLHLPVEMRNVYDVTGAGDTVIACLAAAISGGANFQEAAKFANRAAGLVIEKLGTTAITLDMLRQNEN